MKPKIKPTKPNKTHVGLHTFSVCLHKT